MTLEANAARALAAQRPNDPAAQFALAQALDRAGDPERAMARLHDALRRAPGVAAAHNPGHYTILQPPTNDLV